MRVRLVVLAVVLALLLSACVSIPPTQDEASVAALIDLMNMGSIPEVAGQTNLPFLFESELVLRQADVEMIWQRFRDEGVVFMLEPGGSVPASAGDYKAIADRFDLQVFFSADGYVGDDAIWITVETATGAFSLLLGGEANRLPQILGITGGRR